jgi:hypothetical protein
LFAPSSPSLCTWLGLFLSFSDSISRRILKMARKSNFLRRCFLSLSPRRRYYQVSFTLFFEWTYSGWARMKIGDWLKSEVEYGRDLADSGWQGARSALLGKPVGEILSSSVRASWAPTVMGAGVGALCALLAERRKPRPVAIVVMGVVGSFVGFTAGVAWETRQLSSGIARGALRNIGSTRDSHWLGKHPINFG